MEKIATDTYSFAAIRKGGFVYVDKTALLKPLADGSIGKQFFVARPRRFGKSLAISTLQCLFEGRRDLFRGLAIEADWDWTKSWPVLHLDMGSCQAATVTDLWRKINTMLKAESERLGVPLREDEPVSGKFQFLMSDMIAAADRAAKAKDANASVDKMVLLVDEYDKPLLGHLGRADVNEIRHSRICNTVSGTTNTFTLADHARLVFGGTAVLYFGEGGTSGAWTEVNFDSDQSTTVPYGIAVGSYGNGVVMNIRGGHYLKSNGNDILIPYGATPATVNVYDGCLHNAGSTLYPMYLYGLGVGHTRVTLVQNQTGTRPGTLNVFDHGVVTNGGSHIHFLVGVGKKTQGTVNVFGGRVIHTSTLQPMIGNWGGEGAFNVHSNGFAYMNKSVYVGGANTNDIDSFSYSPAPGQNHQYNGDDRQTGGRFDRYYELTNRTSRGSVTVASGCFAVKEDAIFSRAGTGTLTLGPDAEARFVARNVALSNSVYTSAGAVVTNSTTLSFTFGTNGTGCVVCGVPDAKGDVATVDGTFTIAPGSRLVVDASALTDAKTSYYPLVKCGSVVGDFAEDDVTFTPPAPQSGNGSAKIVKTTRNGMSGYWLQVSRGTLLLFR